MPTAPTFVGFEAGGDSSTNQRLAEVPAAAQVGDTLKLGFYIEWAVDFPLVGLETWEIESYVENPNAAVRFLFLTVRRRVQVGDPTEYLITWDGNFYWNTYHLTCRRGGDPSVIADAVSQTAINTTADSSVIVPSITTVTGNAMLVMSAAWFDGGARTATPPSGFLERVEFGTNWEADSVQAVAGASGSKTAPLAGGTTFWAGTLQAERGAPDAVGGPFPPFPRPDMALRTALTR